MTLTSERRKKTHGVLGFQMFETTPIFPVKTWSLWQVSQEDLDREMKVRFPGWAGPIRLAIFVKNEPWSGKVRCGFDRICMDLPHWTEGILRGGPSKFQFFPLREVFKRSSFFILNDFFPEENTSCLRCFVDSNSHWFEMVWVCQSDETARPPRDRPSWAPFLSGATSGVWRVRSETTVPWSVTWVPLARTGCDRLTERNKRKK